MPKTTRATGRLSSTLVSGYHDLLIWQYVIGRLSWTACVSPGMLARVKAMEQTEYVYCVLDTGERPSDLTPTGHCKLLAPCGSAISKDPCMQQLIITLSMHKDT
jgi:hypothetical protein